ncbi:aKG-HExxH-type peptide beta-hydroxylase [Streptomyces sp. NRRL WC-3549]|uniref:aKG-HExxH-type peptide beta-hydroxylase n=1 Tax=Streptomyces sp. NRRL WC-3549 TaxID=1463925 RepID=UPI0004CB04B4|nr:HEXXH motif-containing putative peptide modification protein [Streptomyces sp. NRRL WC-3549]
MYAPIRMPGPLFDEIAAGGGSPEAVAFLVRGERTRRLVLLRALLDRLDADPALLGPLDATAAWTALEEAATRAPGPVDDLLLSPQVGSWLAHTLRRLHGTASGPPLWADAGQLAAVAATAAVHAGTETTLLLPARGASVSLPALGMVRLPGPDEDGFHAVPIEVRAGRITVHGPHGPGVSVRPLDAPESAHWLPVHRLPTGPGIAPRRLGPDELHAWQDLFADAVALLRRDADAGPGGLRPEEISRIVPWQPTDRESGLPVPSSGLSASTGDAFASMVIARPPDPVALAETLVHEFQHSKLGALLHLFPLIEDDERAELHYAPWRADPRHLPGLLHGAYAFVGVTGFWRARARDTDAGPRDRAAFLFALRRLQTRMVLRTLATRARLTVAGQRLVARLTGTVDGWLREPVEPAALARARAAAVSHRVEWRLRNLRCGQDERDRLAKAWRFGSVPVRGGEPLVAPGPGGYWQDDRCALYMAPDTAAGTGPGADALLVAGHPRAALSAYAARLAAGGAPGARVPAGGAPEAGVSDPHALAGWLLAHTALRPADRRLLARPERSAALFGMVEPARWAEAARWLAG